MSQRLKISDGLTLRLGELYSRDRASQLSAKGAPGSTNENEPLDEIRCVSFAE